MQNLSNISVVRDLLRRHGIALRHSLGQNFLVNPSVCPRIAECARTGPDYGVLEIGAGIGVLTRELAARCGKVVSLEIDERLIPVLKETLADCPNARVVRADAMEIDLHALLRDEMDGLQVAVAANLPYYITSPLMMRLLESRLPVESITVMVQKEAAARLCARPGERACGAVSAAVWYYSEPEILFHVSRGSFLPPPDVDSSVIRLNVRARPPVAVPDENWFFRVVRAAFCQRRKTVCNALSSGLPAGKETISRALDSCSIPAQARAESLSLDQLAALSGALLPLSGL